MFYRLLFLTVFLSGCQLFQYKSTSGQAVVADPEKPAQTTATKVFCPIPPKPKPCPVCVICPVKTTPLAISSPLVIGAIEKVRVSPPGITLNARIDTGAKSSSLHAINIVTFEREGKRWVSFDTLSSNGSFTNLKLPVERQVRITRANDELQKRYVVKMWLEIGAIHEKVDVTLTNRSALENPLLVGRNLLIDTAIVDVSQRFTQK